MNKIGSSLGIDIGGTKIIIIQVDNVTGEVIEHVKVPTEADKGFQFNFNKIVVEISNLLSRQNSIPDVLGVGVAGQVLSDSYLKGAPNLKWYNIPLKKLFEETLRIPTYILNDVRAAVWEEWMHGTSKGVSDLICIMIGTGIGGGIISQNRLITGSSGIAGEIGHFPINLLGPKCSCGSVGCLESIAGGWALAYHAKELIKKNEYSGTKILHYAENNAVDKITAREVLQAANDGDELASFLVDNAINAITSACVGLTNLLNPSRILIGGGLGLVLPDLKNRIQQGINSRSLEAARDLEVHYMEFKENAVALGAASYAYSKPKSC